MGWSSRRRLGASAAAARVPFTPMGSAAVKAVAAWCKPRATTMETPGTYLEMEELYRIHGR